MSNSKALVIVESPTKCKTIGKILGREYILRASGGHIVDLPKNRFGVQIANDFKPTYVLLEEKKKYLEQIKKALKGIDTIYVATDPDREGEAIGWQVIQRIKGSHKVWRVIFTEITEQGVKEGMKHPTSLNLQKVLAQQARRILDRVVGYQISPLLCQNIAPNLSAGRVQSVALRFICEREEEIEKFTPEEYWSITAELITAQGEPFEAKLTRFQSKKITISSEKDATEHCQRIEKECFLITNFQEKEEKKKPPPPFITSTLQQAAASQLNFSVSRTMQIAQQLYEGIPIGGSAPQGLITYMRTDSVRVAKPAVKEAREVIKEKFGFEYLPDTPNVYRSRKTAQEAHEAIRPTFPHQEPETLKKYLSHEQYLLYKLIWTRFLASQMKNALFNIVTVDILAGDYLFRATGRQVKFLGFIKLQKEILKEEEKKMSLPLVKKGEKLSLKKVTPHQHFTKPPPRFSEASLVRELEKRGIGRPSTYATIISTLQTRGYVQKEKGQLLPQEVGRWVNKMLVENFPVLLDPAFTARMEEDLDKIEAGQLHWVEALKIFYKGFSQEFQKAKEALRLVKKAQEQPVGEKCQICGREMVIKLGRYGKFISCSGYPECKNAKPLPKEKVAKKCPQCGQEMVVREGKFGSFLACPNYPQCRVTLPVGIGLGCPYCGGEIVIRYSKKGKRFYGCSNYPKCRFATWQEPIKTQCPQCATAIMIRSGEKLRCVNKECGYTEENKSEI
jgi:DNA topoisomerase-1